MKPRLPTLLTAGSAALGTCVVALISTEAVIFSVLRGLLYAGIVIVFMRMYFSDEERANASKPTDTPILVSVIATPALFAVTSLSS